MSRTVEHQAILAQKTLTYLDGLYRYAMSLCHSQVEAEDLVQETYLRAARAFGQLAPDSNLKAWLYAILRNTWLNQLRHNRSGPRMVDLDSDEGVEAASPVTADCDPYSSFLAGTACQDVRAAVDNLPAQYREVIILREFEGLSYHDIGTVLGIPPGTVMSRLGRARDRLRDALRQWRRDLPARAAIVGEELRQ